MTPKKIPILLTSSVIAYDEDVALRDTDERVRLALQSIEEWFRIDPTLPMVLCDGSSFDFSEQIAKHFPKALVECLPFENNQTKVKKYGRGYGEGEIVRYALQNSQFIADAGCFAKCSSKLWVENFQCLATEWNENFLCKGVFLDAFSPTKNTVLSYIDTRFYIASTTFYQNHLIDAHLDIDRNKNFGLEECFLKILLNKEFKKIMFTTPPVIYGVGGGTGAYYKNTFSRKLKESFRLGLVKRHSMFHDLFA